MFLDAITFRMDALSSHGSHFSKAKAKRNLAGHVRAHGRPKALCELREGLASKLCTLTEKSNTQSLRVGVTGKLLVGLPYCAEQQYYEQQW